MECKRCHDSKSILCQFTNAIYCRTCLERVRNLYLDDYYRLVERNRAFHRAEFDRMSGDLNAMGGLKGAEG